MVNLDSELPKRTVQFSALASAPTLQKRNRSSYFSLCCIRITIVFSSEGAVYPLFSQFSVRKSHFGPRSKIQKSFVIHLEHFQCMLFKILAQQKHFYQFSKIFGVWLSRIFLSHGPKLLGHYRDPRTKRVQERDETSNLVSLNHEEVDSVLIWSYVQWLRLF